MIFSLYTLRREPNGSRDSAFAELSQSRRLWTPPTPLPNPPLQRGGQSPPLTPPYRPQAELHKREGARGNRRFPALI